MKNKILIIGPFPPPISGVSLANEVVARGLVLKNWKVGTLNTEYSKNLSSNHGTMSFEKIFFLKTYLLFFKIFLYKIIYITIGQSFFGVVKYLPFILLGKILDKRLVVHLHGNHLLNEYNSLKGIKKHVFYYIIASFDYGIVLSNSLRNNFHPFIKEENIFELNNFFEESLSIPKEKLISMKDYKEIKVVFLSNLIEEKGINILLQTISKLNKKGIIVKIKVAGKKTIDNDLSHFFEELNHLEYVGLVHGKEKQNLLVWSNVFCLPTFYKMEGQPISILEAMALGNLILTTEHAGITDICFNQNAVFCQKNNIENLTQILELLSNNLEIIKEKGLFNIDYSREKFSEKQFIENANEILLKCMN